MTRNKIFAFLLVSGFWLLASECAQIVTPGGGPRDLKPPRVVKYIPDSAAINFKAKQIIIAFNEFIQLSDVQKQLVISPPMKHMPDLKTKGKLLLIELKDTLKKNTTYTFNFGKSICDYTEGNAIEDFQYVFSTGSYIDSLKLSGKVKYGFDQKTEKDILVMLYDAFDDSVPYKKMPSYFAKTNADGMYKINNIRTGTYKVFALKDANGNYLYDSPEESIAFSDSLIRIGKNTKLDLTLFKEELKKQKLKKASFAEHGHLIFSFAKSTNDSLKLKFLSRVPKENVIYDYSQNKDTLHFWFSDDLKDTLKIQVMQGNKILDTVRLNPITLEQAKNTKRGMKWMLNAKVNVSKDNLFDLNKGIIMQFNHPVPIATEHVSNIKLISKFKMPLNCRDTAIAGFVSKYRKAWGTTCGVDGDSLYNFFVPPGTFTDIFGLTNDTVKIDFKAQNDKFYGTLKLNFKIKKTDFKLILQLLDEQDNVIKQDLISETQILNYSYLYPGKCKLKIIYDTNGDGKWTTGDHFTHRQPEKIIYYSGDITIRSNWDLELDWSP